MSHRARKRAPTRLRYPESSDEENGIASLTQPRAAPPEAKAAGTSSSLPTALSSSASQSQLLKSELESTDDDDDDLLGNAPKPKPPVEKPHPSSRHSVAPILACRPRLLAWYDKEKNNRGMPWRKAYDPDLGVDARNQRAYEVLTSEIMLQQTQVTTVIPYYKKWMETFPTIHDLAAADIEAVNQRWKGLGYYTRAARLLAAAKKVVNEFDGEFPSNAASMEKVLPGVGRYTAGAVCSIVYNERTPAVDTNVQRLLSRLLALYAPFRGHNSKEPVELIWKAAHKLVDGCSDAGALNQALIELGSTVCKPFPLCMKCPLELECAARKISQCRGTAETDIEDICGICEPVPASLSVTRFPMYIEKNPAKEATCAVNVLSWQDHESGERWVVLVRRPETGLLAGLYEFPTLPVTATDGPSLDAASSSLLTTYLAGSSGSTTPGQSPSTVQHSVECGAVLHLFSHIRMTYHVRNTTLAASSERPDLRQPSDKFLRNLREVAEDGGVGQVDEKRPSKKRKRVQAKSKSSKGLEFKGLDSLRVRWVRASEVENENISTGALKIWKLAESTRMER